MTISIDQKLDLIIETLTSIEARINYLQAGHGASEKTAEARPNSKKLSLKEFLLERPPETDVQRTLAIGFFLENRRGMAAFNKGDLEKGYADSKEPLPSNIRMNIQRCIKNGHFMESDEKKDGKIAYVVTRSGEQFVAANFKKS